MIKDSEERTEFEIGASTMTKVEKASLYCSSQKDCEECPTHAVCFSEDYHGIPFRLLDDKKLENLLEAINGEAG